MVAILPTIQIISDPDLREGQPIIEGTALRVADLVAYWQEPGQPSPEDLADLFLINISHVYAALSYYHQHQDEIERQLQQEQDKQWISDLMAQYQQFTVDHHPEFDTLSDEKLWLLIHYRLPWQQEKQQEAIRAIRNTRTLTPAEQAILDQALADDHAFVRVRSTAMLVLKQRGYDIINLLKSLS